MFGRHDLAASFDSEISIDYLAGYHRLTQICPEGKARDRKTFSNTFEEYAGLHCRYCLQNEIDAVCSRCLS